MQINVKNEMFEHNHPVKTQRVDPSLIEYLKYLQYFTKVDWIKYIAWIGMMLSLAIVTTAFILIGVAAGANLPNYVWLIPIGTLGFTLAISLDNIAHTAIYKAWISQAEFTIHKFTTTAGVASIIALIFGYNYPRFLFVPILVLIALSIIYSLIDEGIHWIRYVQGGSGMIEVTCHFLILVFHPIMTFAWLLWYLEGYPGVAGILNALGIL